MIVYRGIRRRIWGETGDVMATATGAEPRPSQDPPGPYRFSFDELADALKVEKLRFATLTGIAGLAVGTLIGLLVAPSKRRKGSA